MSEIIAKVTVADEAKAFLEFEYAETKDLTKQFLTVVAAVLAVSVTFSEKIVDFSHANPLPRKLMMITWGLCLLAFIAGGLAIFFIYNAGALAKAAVLHQTERPYKGMKMVAYWCLNLGGFLFVLGLGLMAWCGALRIL
jgi:hypothetical protein